MQSDRITKSSVNYDNISGNSTAYDNSRINSNNVQIEEYDVLKSTNSGSKYSNTSHTDKENIYINRISNIINNLRISFDKENPYYYAIYRKYSEGLTLDQIVSGELDYNKFKQAMIDSGWISEEEINMYNGDLVKEYMDGISTIIKDNPPYMEGLSPEMMNSTVEEIVASTFGYDAMVLKNEDGNYMIVNACTNNDSGNDIGAIAYALSDYFTGSNDLTSAVINSLLKYKDNISNDRMLGIVETDFEKVYKGQINDNIELIKKYSKKAQEDGCKIEQYGYSLGGGISSAAYSEIKYKADNQQKAYNFISNVENEFSRLYVESSDAFDTISLLGFDSSWISFYDDPLINDIFSDSKLTREEFDMIKVFLSQSEDYLGIMNSISSVTVYNPYLLFGQINDENKMRAVIGDDKFLIYSAGGDVVTIANDLIDDFRDQAVFLDATFDDDVELKTFNDLLAILVYDKGCHGMACLNQDCFDENGNLIQTVEPLGLLEIYEIITKQKIDLSKINVPDNALENSRYKFEFGGNSLIQKLLSSKIPEPDQSMYNIGNVGEVLGFVTKDILDNGYLGNTLDLFKFLMKYNGSIQEQAPFLSSGSFAPLYEYIYTNLGNYNYDEFIDVVALCCTPLVYDIIAEYSWDIGDNLTSYSDLSSYITQYLSNDSVKESVLDVVSLYMVNDKEGCKAELHSLINNAVNYFVDSYVDGTVADEVFSLGVGLLLGPLVGLGVDRGVDIGIDKLKSKIYNELCKQIDKALGF